MGDAGTAGVVRIVMGVGGALQRYKQIYRCGSPAGRLLGRNDQTLCERGQLRYH
jgi:hypothetical protein